MPLRFSMKARRHTLRRDRHETPPPANFAAPFTPG
jgi:hypothetical protein